MSEVAQMKRCKACGDEKPATFEFFYRSKSCKDGLEGRCKKCHKEHRYVENLRGAVNRPTECAACGILITQPKTGAVREFCNYQCQRAGRAFCKACGEPLIQSNRPQTRRKNFCNDICAKRYKRIGEIKSSYLEERYRSECIVCGKPIEQNRYRARKYCSQRCANRYTNTGRDKAALHMEWGTFGPETQKVLREVQQLIGIGAAKRLATAIDREYVRRKARWIKP